MVVLVVLVLCVACIAVVELKSYPMDYADGVLLVDPNVMQRDCFEGVGVFFGMFLGWYCERRWVNFEIDEISVGERVLRASEAEAYEEAQERRKAGGEETPSQGGGKKTVINVTVNIENFAGGKEDAEEFANELLERLQEILDRKEAAF